MLTEDEVRHIAKLARLGLSDKEIAKFQPQLSAVLDYMDILKEVDTEDVTETSQVTGLMNVMEKDEILSGQAKRDELLKCTQLPVDSKQVRVKNVLK